MAMFGDTPVTGADPMMEMDAPQPLAADGKTMERATPQVDEKRKAAVRKWQDTVLDSRNFFEPDFKQMIDNNDFVHGLQWSKRSDDQRYVANITLRHIQQKVSQLYAKNPKAVAKRRERIMNTVWDGSPEQLQQARATLQNTMSLAMMGGGGGGMPGMDGGMGAAPMGPSPAPQLPAPGGAGPMPGMPGVSSAPAPGMGPSMPGMGTGDGMMGGMGGGGMGGMANALMGAAAASAAAIVMDAEKVKMYTRQMDTIARTLELFYQYNVDEQPVPLKKMLKAMIRRALIAKVGYVKLTFQRTMGLSPEIQKQITDTSTQLAKLKQLAEDRADDEFTDTSAEMDQLTSLLKSLTTQEVVTREGILLDYPLSNAIIPDRKCKLLSGFVGCDFVAEEFFLTPDEIQSIYGKDVSSSFSAFQRVDRGGVTTEDNSVQQAIMRGEHPANSGAATVNQNTVARVWEIYCKVDGLVYVVCEGYPDFLREPAPPEFYTERFWPWFPFVPNETSHPGRVFPPSDVDIIRDMQMEINRARQGLREHRKHNRPKIITSAGTLDQEDQDLLKESVAHSVVELNGLQPNQKIDDILQSWRGSPIDPNLYETQGAFEDILRSVGTNDAMMGATSGGTATEANLAQAAVSTQAGSNIDDLDEMLNELARAASQILLLNVSEQTVKKIIGDGAVWPTLTKAEVASEVWLEVKAGSTGKPNQAVEIQNFERLAPLIMQIPGLKGTKLAEEAIRRLDDTINVSEWIAEGAPSIVGMNAMKSPMTEAQPGMQGPQGSQGGPSAVPPPAPDSAQPSAVGGSASGGMTPPNGQTVN